MAQQRKVLKQRLQAKGLWGDYLSLRNRLVKEGMPPAEAREEALRQVEARPPRQPDPQPSESPSAASAAEEEEVWPDFGSPVPNYQSAQWVAENLASPLARPQDAPSGLAWGLLLWVRRSAANERAFWNTIWPKLLPNGTAHKQHQGGAAPDPSDDFDEGELALGELLDRTIARINGTCPHCGRRGPES
jgi:hypothetical protein